MPSTPTVERLRGLILSATELKSLTQWDDVVVEDYLNLIDNLVTISDIVDTKVSDLRTTTVVGSISYTILDTDDEIFFNTDGNAITAYLPEGVGGTTLRLINTGTSQNSVTLVPFGADLLFGDIVSEFIYDTEVLIVTFDPTRGWY